MIIAHDNNGNRIFATISGQIATCPLCEEGVRAYCGTFVIKHWKHLSKPRDCDSWKEHETEWHLNWKNHFPKSCQEVIINKQGIKHRADVQVPDGRVIEFQNSNISPFDIAAREEFYENMAWVVNAKSFAANIRLKSYISHLLANIDEWEREALEETRRDYSRLRFETIKEIEELEKNTRSLSAQLNKAMSDKTYLVQYSDFKDSMLDFMKSSWENKQYKSYGAPRKIAEKLEGFKTTYCELNKSIKDCNQHIDGIRKHLDYIDSHEKINIEARAYIKVQYKMISENSFSKALAVKKTSGLNLMEAPVKFNSKEDFLRLKYHEDKFDFFVDPSQRIEEKENLLENYNAQLFQLEENFQRLNKNIETEALEQSKVVLNELVTDISGLEFQLENLKLRLDALSKTLESMPERLQQETNAIREDYKAERQSAREENKGLYHLEWKRERKCWRGANATLYFDMGNDELLKFISKDVVEKISKEEFIGSYAKSH